jgi:hypothetical protein
MDSEAVEIYLNLPKNRTPEKDLWQVAIKMGGVYFYIASMSRTPIYQ